MSYKVTIGVPVYQAEHYVQRALESVLGQSYRDLECLVVDDASTDASMDVVRRVQQSHPRGSAIRILSHSRNLGVAASRNLIIDEARGDYLYFLDADDVLVGDAIALLMTHLKSCNAEIAFGSYVKVDVAGAESTYQYPFSRFLEAGQLATFAYRKFGGIQASACNYVVQLSLLRSCGLRFIDASYWEDMAFTFDLVAYVRRAVLLPDITYRYCCREHSLSNYQYRARISRDEVLRNAQTVDYMKQGCARWAGQPFYPARCQQAVMTDFYVVCHLLKRRRDIVPPMTNRELRSLMRHPATLRQILSFPNCRKANLALWGLGKLPPWCCVLVVGLLGRWKKLI